MSASAPCMTLCAVNRSGPHRTRSERVWRAIGSPVATAGTQIVAGACNVVGWIGWAAGGAVGFPTLEAGGAVFLAAVACITRRIHRGNRYNEAIPPGNIRVVLDGARTVPVECVYQGRRDGVHVWFSTAPISAGAAHKCVITGTIPPSSAVFVDVII